MLSQQAVPDTTSQLGEPSTGFLALTGETLTVEAESHLVAKQVVLQGGAYLMVVEANHPGLLRACAEITAEHPRRPRRSLG